MICVLLAIKKGQGTNRARADPAGGTLFLQSIERDVLPCFNAGPQVSGTSEDLVELQLLFFKALPDLEQDA